MKKIFILLILLVPAIQAEPLFDSYHDNQELNTFVEQLNSPYLEKTILAQTKGKNKIHCLKLSSSKNTKPAILILGDTNPASPVGTEILLEWLKLLLKNEEDVKNILSSNSIYIIPRPFPDSLRSLFNKPLYETKTNLTEVDFDSDLLINEDGTEDLNKDGFITLMRLKDEDGTFFQNPNSEYLMTKKRNEEPSYKVFSEGLDNDKDEKYNEDPQGGVNPNRNFSFSYPYFQKDAGVHQFSEIESKAIADFAFNHPEIFLVFSFGEEDNLLNPWKEDQNKKKQTIRQTIYKDDEAIFDAYSKNYIKAFNIKSKKSGKFDTSGSFVRWAYYHFGRISLSAAPWSIPTEQIEGKIAQEIKEIKWLEKNRPQALLKWQSYNHPDFPGKSLEIGGVKPFYSFIPNRKVCVKKAMNFHTFISESIDLKAKLTINHFNEIKLNEHISRLSLKVKNNGKLPSRPEIGIQSRKMHPINFELKLPDGWKLYKGHLKGQINQLKVNSSEELEWLVMTNNNDGKAEIKLKSPHLTEVSAETGDNK